MRSHSDVTRYMDAMSIKTLTMQITTTKRLLLDCVLRMPLACGQIIVPSIPSHSHPFSTMTSSGTAGPRGMESFCGWALHHQPVTNPAAMVVPWDRDECYGNIRSRTTINLIIYWAPYIPQSCEILRNFHLRGNDIVIHYSSPHQKTLNCYPLFRIRSWNKGMRCKSLFILLRRYFGIFNLTIYNCRLGHILFVEQNGCSRYFCLYLISEMKMNYRSPYVATSVVRCKWLAVCGLCGDWIGSSLALLHWYRIYICSRIRFQENMCYFFLKNTINTSCLISLHKCLFSEI